MGLKINSKSSKIAKKVAKMSKNRQKCQILLKKYHTCHGSLVDVSTTHNDVSIIYNHHFAVNVDWETQGFTEFFSHWLGRRFESVNVFTVCLSFSCK